MHGGFALGQTDPAAGLAAGASTPMTLKLKVDAPDIQRFVTDATHTAKISGTVQFEGFGSRALPVKGSLKLMPDGGGKLLMQYTLDFQRDGKDCSIVGKKLEQSGLHVWKDTTTLFTELHDGKGGQGPVAGAGVLHLNIGDVAKMGLTFKALHADGVGQTLGAIERFGRFFVGSLWERYVG
jgi:hypothetical protein